MHAFIPTLNVLTPRLLFKAVAAWEVTVSLMVLATTLLRGPLRRLGGVSIGQPAGVINGSGERRYDNLATADREEQRRLRGCRGDGGDSDAGVLEGRRCRRIYYDTGGLPMTVALADVYLVVADVRELVLPGAEVLPEVLLPEVPLVEVPTLPEPPPQAATANPAATSTEITGCPRTTA